MEKCKEHIVHLNAGISHSSVPLRLMDAMNEVGMSSEIVTMNSTISNSGIHVVTKTMLFRVMRKLDAVFLAIGEQNYPDKASNMPFSYFHVGMNIAKQPWIIDADVIVIHWIGGTFLSTKGLRRLLQLGKKVIFVCHDNGHFTGGCHVRMGCMKYTDACGQCPQLGSNKKKDWSYKLFLKRMKLYQNADITIVSPSVWMDNNVTSSRLFFGKKHYIIPNPIDTDIYCPKDKTSIRNKYQIPGNRKVVLFGAANALSAPYKGYDKLLEVLDIFTSRYKELGPVEAYVFGADGETCAYNSQFSIYYMGYLDEKTMVEAYQLADVYIVPSLEDSFNNTVAESMAAGTPVAAFATGGIIDIIDHKENGYLAKYGDASDLADGVAWVLKSRDSQDLPKKSRQKIVERFSYPVVGRRWKKLIKGL